MTTHAEIQKALLAAAIKRGYNDFKKALHTNPYDPKSQAALHRNWDQGHAAARKEAPAEDREVSA